MYVCALQCEKTIKKKKSEREREKNIYLELGIKVVKLLNTKIQRASICAVKYKLLLLSFPVFGSCAGSLTNWIDKTKLGSCVCVSFSL